MTSSTEWNTHTRELSGWELYQTSTALNLRKTTLQKCAVVPRRARIEGSYIVASLNSRLEINIDEEEK